MLKLCICDDRETDINEIRQLAQQFSEAHPETPIRIQTFRSAYELLHHVRECGGFDLYLLDIIMPDMSGMDLAKLIRERGEAAEILFLTVSREYGVEAFGVNASGYLMKPIKKEDFHQAVLACVKKLAPKENPSIILQTKGGMRKTGIRELLMIESFNHSRVCTLSNGKSVQTAETLSSLFSQLSAYSCFYSPHRAYIVNFDYVDGLSTSELLMTNGKRVPVSRRVYSDLKSAFLEYTLQR